MASFVTLIQRAAAVFLPFQQVKELAVGSKSFCKAELTNYFTLLNIVLNTSVAVFMKNI